MIPTPIAPELLARLTPDTLDRLKAVPIHEAERFRYVLDAGIPQPWRDAYHHSLTGSQVPIIGDEKTPICSYAHDYQLWLERLERQWRQNRPNEA